MAILRRIYDSLIVCGTGMGTKIPSAKRRLRCNSQQ